MSPSTHQRICAEIQERHQRTIDELRAALKAAESGPLSDEAFDIAQSEIKKLRAELAVWIRRADKTWYEKVYTDEIATLKAKLAALEAQPHSATLHDDGYWTWNGSPPYESQYAGWRLKVYLAAGAAPVPEGWRSAVAMAYGHLWHVNNEPMAPIPLRSEESASYAARKLLRDLMTTKERGEAINSVRAMLAAALKEPS